MTVIYWVMVEQLGDPGHLVNSGFDDLPDDELDGWRRATEMEQIHTHFAFEFSRVDQI
jgi:hypothetical protein